MRAVRTAPIRTLVTAGVTLLVLIAAGAGAAPAAAVTTSGVSDSGIAPRATESSRGGNVSCAELAEQLSATYPGIELELVVRFEWKGNRWQHESGEGSVDVTGDPSVMGWSSSTSIMAVIVKGGRDAAAYVAVPAITSDGGLVAPLNSSGAAADISNVTFCAGTVPPPPPPPVDLMAMCMEEASALEVGEIVSFAGPITISDGTGDMETLPPDVMVSYDADAQQIDFSAPFPVVMVVTRSSPAQTHHLDPMATSGSVPFSLNPGSGEMVLCGLAAQVVTETACALLAADLEVGPVPIRNGAVEPALTPAEIKRLVLLEDELEFEAALPVVGVVVTASPSVLHAFDEPVTLARIPLRVTETPDADLVFCMRRLSVVDPETPPSTDTPITPLQTPEPEAAPVELLPVQIASGEGPPVGWTLALVAFVLLAMTGTMSLAMWGRSG